MTREFKETDLSLIMLNVNDDETFEVAVKWKGVSDDGEALASEMEGIAKQAVKNLLEKVEHDPRIEEEASRGFIVPYRIRKAGDVSSSFAVAVKHPRCDEVFERYYDAVDAECAKLQAIWEMAKSYFNDLDNTDLLEGWVEFMIDCHAEVVPTTKADYDNAFLGLVKAVREGGDVDAALVTAEDVLGRWGVLDKAVPVAGMR